MSQSVRASEKSDLVVGEPDTSKMKANEAESPKQKQEKANKSNIENLKETKTAKQKTEVAETAKQRAAVSVPLIKLKLLDCIRSGDTRRLDELIGQIAASKKEGLLQLQRELLHFSVQVGSLAIVKHVVEKNLVDDINYQDPSENGNTPLHLAAITSRNDVVEYLMGLPSINDCIVNNDLKQPIECTSDMDTVQLMSDLRTKYVEAQASGLRKGFETRQFDTLTKIMSSPRARELLDINGTDPVSGETVLLEFVRKEDVPMVRFILSHGGDPFKRSVSGKLPVDVARSPEMRRVIKEACDRQSVLDYTSVPMLGAPPDVAGGAEGSAGGNVAGNAGGSVRNSVESGAGSLRKGPGSNVESSSMPEAAQKPALAAPTFKGFLKKWTNFAGGYKLRWFVLAADGTLSYYKSPTDMENSCRGMIHLAHAHVRMDSSEKCRFEILVTTSRAGGSPVRWHLKANHQIESSRWVWTLQNAIRYARDRQKRRGQQDLQRQQSPRRQKDLQLPLPHTESTPGLHRSSSDSRVARKKHVAAKMPVTASSAELSNPEGPKQIHPHHERTQSRESVVSSSSHASVASSVARGARMLYRRPIHKLGRLGKLGRRSRDALSRGSRGSAAEFVADGDLPESIDSSASSDSASSSPEQENIDGEVDKLLENLVVKKQRPNDHELIIVRNQIRIELESFKEFLDEAVKDPGMSRGEILAVCQRVLANLSQLSKNQDDLLDTRKITLERLFNRQHEISAIWENSVRQLELEIQDREKKICDLEDTIRKVRRSLRASVIISPEDSTPDPAQQNAPEMPKVTRKMSISSIQAPDSELTKFLEEKDSSEDEFFDAEEEEEEEKEEEENEQQENEEEENEQQENEQQENEQEDENLEEEDNDAKSQHTLEQTTTSDLPEAVKQSPVQQKNESQAQQESQKGQQIIPFHPLKVGSSFVVNGAELVNDAQEKRYEEFLRDATFKGYEDPIRTTLKKEDDRPKISLWGVLKSLIGKDMTRMTLPVTFNEPTSLLQRNIEIMEYSDVLDKAAASDDSCLRMVYVAGFAASEYVSTIGRIAKPFNPLLGETYEYARPDKGYRVLCEQVSHHPPISAIVAESPRWAYYGESNVKTRFYGRSFDIKHLGSWFCELYPDHGVVNKSTGKKEPMELYSWKKVNNSVVGIIIGHPTIDNYGQMVIRNHMTGDYMNFSFKRRGWRASTACEVKGDVYSADGTLRYQVGGFWDRKIYAKSASTQTAKKFLIFSANKRQEMLFHLTNFAAGLNAPQPHLLPVVACTDTRLRPDQRAMENGLYDLAAEEKNRLEEKQRAVRKHREETGGVYHASFFVKAKHPITKVPYWRYKQTYWEERRDGKLKHYKDIF